MRMSANREKDLPDFTVVCNLVGVYSKFPTPLWPFLFPLSSFLFQSIPGLSPLSYQPGWAGRESTSMAIQSKDVHLDQLGLNRCSKLSWEMGF